MHSISIARRFSSQARLSSLPTSWAVQPWSARALRSRASLSAGVSPAYSALSSQAWVAGRAGRPSVHSSSSRSSVLTEPCFAASAFCRLRTSSQAAVRPHRPRHSPSASASAQYCSTVGTPGSPIFCSWISVPASSFLPGRRNGRLPTGRWRCG